MFPCPRAPALNSLLLLKLLLVPSLIAGITAAGRRWGPAVAGWLSAFPVVSAPILGLLALERGAAFAAQAAAATLSAVLAILVFGIAYCRLALRHGWPLSLLFSLAAYALAVALLHLWAPPLWLAAGSVLLALWLAPAAYPAPPPYAAPSLAARGDLLWRMLAAAALVLGVTGGAETLGPRLSGLLAMFPVMASVLAVFSHHQAGAGFSIRLLRAMVYGYYAFAGFCLALALALPAMGRSLAFALALAVAVLLQALARWRMSRAAP